MRLRVIPELKLLKIEEATSLELDQLEISLTKQLEGWNFKKKYFPGWDGKICFINNGSYIFLGLWKHVYDICQQYKFPIQIDGLSEYLRFETTFEEFKEWVDKKFKGNKFQPRDYQIETAFKILKFKGALGSLATSAGKTLITFIIFAYMIEVLKYKKILMIVPNVSLVEQADGDFYDYNETHVVDYEIQMIYSGKKLKKNSNIIVGTYQSLVKKDKEFFSQFEAVCVDETHKAKSTSIKTILSKCLHTKYTFGVSGTIPDPNTLDGMTVMSQTGPLVQDINSKFLIDKGHITPVEIKVLKLNYAPEEVREAFYKASKTQDSKKIYQLERDYIIENKKRLDFICNTISSSNKNSLVMFHRTAYGKRIYEKLRNDNKGREVYYIDGSTPVENREYYKKKMEENIHEVEHKILNMGEYQIAIPYNDKVLLSNGNKIYASELSINDDIDDEFLKKYKKESLPE